MIRSHFGLSRHPFAIDEDATLLEHQQRHLEILRVHNHQGGFCVILGEPGTGKSTLKNAITRQDPRQCITPVINRSLHTWPNILRLLCAALKLEADGNNHKCEARLIAEARSLNSKGKTLVPIIDDAHLLPAEALHRLRLLLEDFPKNHNLILLGQPALNTTLQLRPNGDLKSRVTYSGKLLPLAADDLTEYIHAQLDACGLPHHTYTEDALHLILRSSEGILRAARNLCTATLIEAVRDQVRTVDLKQVNAVLMQPHWRHDTTGEPLPPPAHGNRNPKSKP